MKVNPVRNVVRIALALLALFLDPALPFAASQLQRSVLVIDQSFIGLPFNTALANAIRLSLNDRGDAPISFYLENLDANRFLGSGYEDDILYFFKRKYRDKPIDVIVVVGSA